MTLEVSPIYNLFADYNTNSDFRAAVSFAMVPKELIRRFLTFAEAWNNQVTYEDGEDDKLGRIFHNMEQKDLSAKSSDEEIIEILQH